jgi:hypothetical protein
MFRVLVGETIIAEFLTAVQSHILVGDILERIVLGKRNADRCATPGFIDKAPADGI